MTQVKYFRNQCHSLPGRCATCNCILEARERIISSQKTVDDWRWSRKSTRGSLKPPELIAYPTDGEDFSYMVGRSSLATDPFSTLPTFNSTLSLSLSVYTRICMVSLVCMSKSCPCIRDCLI